MFLLDALLVLLAALFAAPMLYGIWAGRQRAQGVDVASFGELLRDGWATVAPALRAAGWVARKALAPARDHGPPPWAVSSVSAIDYDTRNDTAPANMPRDIGLSARLSELRPDRQAALLAIILDTDTPKGERAGATARATLVAALVAAGWQTGEIRAVLKGDNGVIGPEVEAARQRLGVSPTPRFVTINNGKDGKVAI